MTQPSLTEYLSTSPSGTLEEVAKNYQVTLLDVVKALPKRTVVSGQHFDAIWDEVQSWGDITFIVHTSDIILEIHNQLPSGHHRHGYFNLRGNKGFSGHIKAENCSAIAFVERKFMEIDTASIIFFNQQGAAMFKIFLGRDSHRQLLAEQLTSFHQLAEKLAQDTL